MQEKSGKNRKDREETSDDYAHDVKSPGPLREFLKGLISSERALVPFDIREVAYVAVHLPSRWTWTAESLEAVLGEIVEFSTEPESAREYLDERLSGPFAAWMAEHGRGFEAGLSDYCLRMDLAMPDAERVIVLKAVLVRLYDVACQPADHPCPKPESLPAAWRRNAS